VRECRRCRLRWTSPRPRLDELHRWYPADYGPHQPPPLKPIRKERWQDRWRLELLKSAFGYEHLDVARWPRARAALARAAVRRPPWRLPPFVGSGRALDVGCGSGGYLARLREFGWSARGIDSSPAAVAAATALGVTAEVATLAEFRARSREAFDWIRLASVLEHLPDPLEGLRACRALLGPGGRVQVILPNSGQWLFHVFRSRWFDLDLPRHLFHFTPATLAMAAQVSGLAVESLRLRPNPRGLQRSLGYAFPSLAAAASSRLARRLLSPPTTLLAWLGQADEIEAVLRAEADPPRGEKDARGEGR
jgi:SAM-dependent methyltransferase